MIGLVARIIITPSLIFLLTPGVLLSSEYLELVDQPIVIRPACVDADKGSGMLGAAYLSMRRFNWEIQSAEVDYFRAKNCRGGPGAFCVVVDVFLTMDQNESGRLEFWLSPGPWGARTRNKVRKTVVRWIGNVQGAFGDYQCGAPEALTSAYSALIRREKPSWAIASGWVPEYREKGKFTRWFEWYDKYRKK